MFRRLLIPLAAVISLACASAEPPTVEASSDDTFSVLYAPAAGKSFAIPDSLKDGGLMLGPQQIKLQFFGTQLGDFAFTYADHHVRYPWSAGMRGIHLPVKRKWSRWQEMIAGAHVRMETFRLAGLTFGLANWTDAGGDHSFYLSGKRDSATIATFLAIARSMTEGFECPRELQVVTNSNVRIYQSGKRLLRCNLSS
ncbi:MAG TPA: hypothetical protein VMM17_09525 [Gemmatimonadaceae bacterium]|nr:hypothetical protein [Gemmatimonadaceae bacterium]